MKIKYKAAVITVSDKGYSGEREDKSGPLLKKGLEELDFDVSDVLIVPDERDQISAILLKLSQSGEIDLIITTGGTGAAARDITPEATMDIVNRPMPGLAELLRYEGKKITNRAVLSRGVSGICRETLIINLAGSPKAVVEGIEILAPVLLHAITMLKGVNLEHK
ncbi:MAG: MogA/MoaB family molybdenum cofactor biosynthesis protein [Spirochaetaceae bacterium]|jgi:molybdopterin adenylyltransferase|nr:MogA/MoaB family molybdenum cofactor biosynthesis protein [Spirochaetaceae bacterium]